MFFNVLYPKKLVCLLLVKMDMTGDMQVLRILLKKKKPVNIVFQILCFWFWY